MIRQRGLENVPPAVVDAINSHRAAPLLARESAAMQAQAARLAAGGTGAASPGRRPRLRACQLAGRQRWANFSAAADTVP